MRSLPLPFILLVFALLRPETGAAQSGTVAAPVLSDSTPAAAAPAAKKKKGVFGKVKGLAKNKIVKTVAKAALCTVVPGGQVIAGALDAAETKNVAGAAATAVTGGGSCMPGMAGMAPAGAAAGGIGAAASGLGAGAAGAGLPGQPSAAMPGMAMSPEQMKQLQEQYKRMGMDPAQLQQMMAGMPSAPAAAGPTAGPSLVTEKGKLIVRGLPWVQGSELILQGSEPGFGLAVRDLAQAIIATPGTYRIEALVEDQGGKKESKLLASKRAGVVLTALTAEGVPAGQLGTTDGGSDKDPRIVVSKGK